MSRKLFYEKRIINDLSGNAYPIWVIYRLNKYNAENQRCVIDSFDEFELFKECNKVEYRQYTCRGIE